MEVIKIDDPRLDEMFAFMFSFRKGDAVVISAESLRGEIDDGVYIGEFPKHVAGELKTRGVTLYEIKLPDGAVRIVEEKEIEKSAGTG